MATNNGSQGRCIAAKKRPYRKRYKKSVQTLHVALTGVCLLCKQDQTRFALPVETAIDVIKKGTASESDWGPVFDVINLLEELMKSPKLASGDVAGYIEAKHETVTQVLARQRDTGSKALYFEERASLDDLAATWRDMLAQVSNSEMYKASNAVSARVRRVLAQGGGAVGVVEVSHGA